MTKPRIGLSLGVGGRLIAELPHEDGSTHEVELPKGRELDVLWPILHAQQQGIRRVTGTASCPTQWNIDAAAKAFKAPEKRVDLQLSDLDFSIDFSEGELRPPAPSKPAPRHAKPKHQRPVKVPMFPIQRPYKSTLLKRPPGGFK